LHGGEYVGVGELIAKPELLEAAQKFMQLKAEENAEEARRLGELLEAVRTYG
jgi:hypothetical protein